MPSIEAGSIDSIICDPPYPEISRSYGRMNESDWADMMHEVVRQSRRILKPTGSAVFILQPNSKHVGSMRLWLWEFMVWCGKEWNIVQDAYWWNFAKMPVGGAPSKGTMRDSVKPCVWLGNPDCYKNQNGVLWTESDRQIQRRTTARFNHYHSTSGQEVHERRIMDSAVKRGGVTPFNLLPIPNTNNTTSASAYGHGAGTPQALSDWWTRYICPAGGTVCDPFMGSGTMGLSALKYGCKFIGVERDAGYFSIAQKRIENAQPALFEVA